MRLTPFTSVISLSSLNPVLQPKKAPRFELDTQEGRTEMAITDSNSPHNTVCTVINKMMIVDKFVLGLQTLRTIGESCMQVHSTDYGDIVNFLTKRHLNAL
jgi:hypothetical protein